MRDIESVRRDRGDTAAPSRLRALLTARPPGPGAAISEIADFDIAEIADTDVTPAATLRSAPEPPRSVDPPVSSPAPPPGRPWAGRWGLEPPGARALIAVGVAAALVAAGFLWLSRPRAQALPAAAIRPSLAAQPAIVTRSAAVAIVVDVAGRVRHPGVVTLSPGARVTDAIEAAGGLRPGARAGAVNLARHVVDGEQILVGATAAQASGSPAWTAARGGVPPGSASGSAPGAELDLNASTVEQFDQLPGVGPVLAQRIIDYRTQHGGFRSVDELQEVTGIGARKYADLKDLVRV